MNTQEAGEKVRQGRSVSTEQDSVRRLAEIRGRYDAALAVGAGFAIGPDVPCLLSVIDSLTAERDGAQHELRIARFGYEDTRDQRDIWRTRAEAAEVEVRRLREALEKAAIQAERHMKGPDGYYAIASHARAALATPPSEGQS